MMGSSVLCVILNYRTAEMTLRAAEVARTAMAGVEGEILLVDNDSGDESFERMQDHVAKAGWTRAGAGGVLTRVVQSGRNGGFGAGNNFGMRLGFADGGQPDYYYILNSDAFPAPDAIRLLVRHLDHHPDTGFVGSLIHGEVGETHLTTFRFPSIASEFEGAIRFGPVSRLLAAHRVPVDPPQTDCAVDWLAGASLMMRRTVLEEIGLFDETFFLYFEETDLCLRCRRAGHAITYVPESRVMHIGSVSTGMKDWQRVPEYWFQSRHHYFAKNHGRAYAALATLAHGAGGMLHRLRQFVQRRPFADPPHFLRDLLAHDLKTLFKPRPPASAPPLSAAPPTQRLQDIVSE